ncbi:hypothetical protein D9611_008625 [Ephemerocybe angulata]|uniref:F-box domain-containing protein n=1 Tax=Ephemerocybe angulata TaxID=980116 RepID=A0A8H5EVC5_9AGAR|nr:hypothetical protein D9611_008625 [Tulosesus angulatus]
MNGAAFPDELWRECFKRAWRSELKALSTLSRRFAAIFQPLLFSDLGFPGYFSLSDFTNTDCWKLYTTRLLRIKRRFELIADEHRLSSAVKSCIIRGSHDHRLNALISGQELPDMLIRMHDEVAATALDCCARFDNLRRLHIRDYAIDIAAIRNLEEIQCLETLTLWNCSVSQVRRLNAPSLSKIEVTVHLSEEQDLHGNESWAMKLIQFLPWPTIRICEIQAHAKQILPELWGIRDPSALTHLILPLPRSKHQANALVSVLVSSRALLILELLDSAVEHDDPSKHFEVPAIKPLAVPALQQLEVPIEWAQALVPGRPVQTLRVYRNQNIAFSRNEVGPLETLKTLFATSSCIEKLAIVSLGVNFPLLSVVAEFFPHLRILGAVIPDIDAEELAPTELNPIPANAPTPSRLIQFPVPDLEDLQASLPQIHMDVEDILAKGHPTFYDEPLHKWEVNSKSTVFWHDHIANLPARREYLQDLADGLDRDSAWNSPLSCPAMFTYAAKNKDERPLPKGLQELHLFGAPIAGRERTRFPDLDQLVFVKRLGEHYAALHTITIEQGKEDESSCWVLDKGEWELNAYRDNSYSMPYLTRSREG